MNITRCAQFGGKCGCLSCSCNRFCEEDCEGCEEKLPKCFFLINNPSRCSDAYLRSERTTERFDLEHETHRKILLTMIG